MLVLCLNTLGLQAQNDVVEERTSVETEIVEESKDKKKKDKKEEDVSIDGEFFASLAINIVSVLIIIGFIYISNYHKTEIIFTYFSFNLVIFLLTLVMNNIKFSTGAAFGLFAVFSMLRYRTEGISTKDMTYLFIVIAIGLICALRISIVSMAVICAILILATFLLDGNILIKRQFSKAVLYENITLIKPEHNSALIEDLRNRTGLDIYKVTVTKIDFVRDMAALEIFYRGDRKK
ncbi:MAG TPA: DUF4956 domain-containing protein [Cytophagales bacterium]|nr:DUF4956 domain-containing protein [Cytophagales bacterium]